MQQSKYKIEKIYKKIELSDRYYENFKIRDDKVFSLKYKNDNFIIDTETLFKNCNLYRKNNMGPQFLLIQ